MNIPSTTLQLIIDDVRKGIGAVNFETKPPRKGKVHLTVAYSDYYAIIKKPIAIADIEKKLRQKKYEMVYDFHDDLDRVWQNCKQYNQDESDIFMFAVNLQKKMRAKFLELGIDFNATEFLDMVVEYQAPPKKPQRKAQAKRTPRRILQSDQDELEEEKKAMTSETERSGSPFMHLKKEPEYTTDDMEVAVKKEKEHPRTQRVMREVKRERAVRKKHDVEEEKEIKVEKKKNVKAQKRVQGGGAQVAKKEEISTTSRTTSSNNPSVLCKMQFVKALHGSSSSKVREIIEYGMTNYPDIVKLEDEVNFRFNLSLVTAEFLHDMNDRYDLSMNLFNYI